MLGRGQHAQQAADRLAAKEQDSLVALPALGQVALRHHPAVPVVGRDLEDRVGVAVAAAGVEHRRAAVAVQRLYHHLAALLRHIFFADIRAHQAQRVQQALQMPPSRRPGIGIPVVTLGADSHCH